MEETCSDAQLLARALREPELFGVVFDRHFATIHRYLERRAGPDAADELSGEVFRIAFERRKRFRPVHESALPWLYGLATNLLLKRWRGVERHARALGRLEVVSRNGDRPELDRSDDRVAASAARTRLLEALAGASARKIATSSSSSPGRTSRTRRSLPSSTSRWAPSGRG
jgi:DNA-directed RNA polymerase specialized sigma24 family protein